MSEQLFVTTKEAAELFNMARSVVLQIFRDHNLSPVDLGPGRGRGLRWRRSDIIKIADAIHTAAQTKTAPKKKAREKISQFSVTGKNARDLFAELSTPIQ